MQPGPTSLHLIRYAAVMAWLTVCTYADPVSFTRDIQPILSDRCFNCHGPDGGKHGEKWRGGLRLDTREGALANLVDSKHQIRSRKRADQGLPGIPKPGGERFAIVPSDVNASLLVERIMSTDESEQMPPPDSLLSLSPEEKQLLKQWVAEGAVWSTHWSFEPLKQPDVPEVLKQDWPISALDRFVLARLESSRLVPAPAAEKTTWLRRVTQDLTGLPPTLEEIDAFLKDTTPNADRLVVNRLLQSPDYAEHMTAAWLDLARYADSNGFQFDNERTMWPWRDWVLRAFRQNMPYDRFVIEQLAGDLLPEPTQAQQIATGFNRNHGYSIEGGIIDEEYRVMYANDKTTTAGTLFLGLTLECARCHDHKYDPVSMADYYSFYAFFNTSAEKGAPGDAGKKKKAAPPYIEYREETVALKTAQDKKPPPVLAMVMKEQSRETFILEQGLFNQPGEKVAPRPPEILGSYQDYPANRLGLARWLTAKNNPLFARVTVNRLWQQFFGVGLVKTSDNFGLQGEQPSHPKLLDWLALELRDSGWDLHHVIRSIVLSATYRQDSAFRPELEDPENRLLARGPSFRLSAEMIRDQALMVSGLLHRKMGGPSVKPYQPEGVWGDMNAPKSHAEIYVESTGPDLYRKSLYTYWRRAVPHPAMLTFDAPSRDVCTVQRASTSTPLQALATLHGPIYIEASRQLAERALQQQAPLTWAFRSLLSRPPENREIKRLNHLHASRLRHYQEQPEQALKLMKVGASQAASSSAPAEIAALADTCLILMNLSETLTRK